MAKVLSVKKKLFFIFIFIMCSFKIQAININSIYDINENNTIGYLGSIEGNSYLEIDYRSISSFNKMPEIYKYYPRIKKINDYYILTYHGYEDGGKTGASIYYSLSKDLLNWTEPIKIWRPFNYYNLQSEFDRVLFANCDLLELKDGKLLIYAIYHSLHKYKSNPYASGVVAKICSIVDNKLECNAGTQIDEFNSKKKYIGKYDIGAFIHTGPTWEPHAFYDNNGNIVMTFSSGEPINKNSNFNHSSGGVGTIVSQDNGNSWTEAKYSIFKFIGQYESNGKSVNYYTSQMAVTTPLTDGRYFSVYEMWAPNSNYGIPSDYSIGGTIFSSNYDFKLSSGIKVSDVITESLKDNPSLNDPRGQQSYSGDLNNSFTISNPAAAPYILQFPSGEVVVAYNHNNKQYLKLITSLDNVYSPSDDSKILKTFNYGYWGSVDLYNNNSLISTFPYISNHSVSYEIIHLNNTITSDYFNEIVVDGNNEDWKNISDTLFVGSESQAQAIIRTSHDDNNIYFLIEVLDRDLLDDDNVTLKMNFGDNVYSMFLSKNKSSLYNQYDNPINFNIENVIYNSDNINKNGIFYEFSVNKNSINFKNKMRLFVSLNNKDSNGFNSIDSIFNTNENDINSWIMVNYLTKQNNSDSNSEKSDYKPSNESNSTSINNDNKSNSTSINNDNDSNNNNNNDSNGIIDNENNPLNVNNDLNNNINKISNDNGEIESFNNTNKINNNYILIYFIISFLVIFIVCIFLLLHNKRKKSILK